MATTNASTLDRLRRRRPSAEAALAVFDAAPAALLVGTTLGVLDRRFGLIASAVPVVVHEVLATSGDLAVADRIAFMAVLERHGCVLVVQADGWYHAVTIDDAIDAGQISAMRTPDGDDPVVRIMSIVSERGITPSLGPLACA